jgi:hypothetical protein
MNGLWCIAAAVLLFFRVLPVAAGEIPGAASRSTAVVTAVQGTALLYTQGIDSARVIKQGDRLGRKHEVRVGERSRIEIRFPDGTVMRLSEKSRLSMNQVQINKKTGSKNLNVSLWVGKLWANVKKLVTPDSAVEVKTGNAVAGVRGTVYRVNVEEDKSALIKVYDGSVYVSNPSRDQAGLPASPVLAPVPVSGPHEVPPPMHEVTMEEWHVIVKALQEVAISADGVASQPQEFDPKADADDWVVWNQERDQKLRF